MAFDGFKNCAPTARIKEVWVEMDEPFLKQKLEVIKEIGGPSLINICDW